MGYASMYAINKIMNLFIIEDIGQPHIVGIGLNMLSGSWNWETGGSFKQGDVGWKATVNNTDNCAGFAKSENSAVTFNCLVPQKYLCE
jgi:hypothetical protein